MMFKIKYLFSLYYFVIFDNRWELVLDGDLLNSVLKEATEAMVKLTCPRSTSRDPWHSLGIAYFG